MRLIDADSLIDFIRNLTKEPNGFSKNYDESAIVHFVENQPTAYDVEAVVAELEIEKETANRTYCTFEQKVDLGRVFGLEKAIEIVRGKE